MTATSTEDWTTNQPLNTIQPMSSLTQTLHAEIDTSPEPVLREVLDFLVFLKARRTTDAEGGESLLPLAVSAWDEDWNNPQEDEAWRGL